MQADAAQWYANGIAIAALVTSGISIVVSATSACYARRQAKAGERQAHAGEEALRLQAEALRSQAGDTVRALAIAKESSDAAKASAEALQAQAQDMHQALDAAESLAEANEALAVSGQRGWLIMAGSESSVDSTNDKINVRVQFTFRNVGKTPVGGVRLRHCKEVLDAPPKDFVGLADEYYASVAPDAPIVLYQLCECPFEVFSAIKSGKTKLYFYGNLSYDDIFGYSRTTYWRYAFDGNELLPCEEGNRFE